MRAFQQIRTDEKIHNFIERKSIEYPEVIFLERWVRQGTMTKNSVAK